MSEDSLFSLGENYSTIDLQIFDLKEDRYTIVHFESFRQGFILKENYTAYQNSVYMKLDHSIDSSFYQFMVRENSL